MTVSNYVSFGAVALCIALAWLARLTLPMHRAVRVRNAFLLRRGRREDFEWTPAQVPPGFRLERHAPPAAIVSAVRDSGALERPDDWARALALVTMLVRHARRGGPVRADLTTTWREIVAGHGYCADYVRVYMAAASAAGLFCRQWAFSFDGFGGHGHTFVEVFDRQRGRWSFIDVHNNVYAVETGSLVPLDALSLHEALLSTSPAIEFVRAGEGRLGYRACRTSCSSTTEAARRSGTCGGATMSSRAVKPDWPDCSGGSPVVCRIDSVRHCCGFHRSSHGRAKETNRRSKTWNPSASALASRSLP